MRAECARFIAIMCEYWTKVVHCSEYVVMYEKETTKTAKLPSNQLFELLLPSCCQNGCWKSELVGRKKGIVTRMPSELSERTFTQGRNFLLVNTDGFFYGERSGGHLLHTRTVEEATVPTGWTSWATEDATIMIKDLRIRHDVNYEIMTNHNNSDPLRLTRGVSEGCPSAPFQYLSFTAARKKIRVKWSGLARYWRSTRTHSTLKRATLIGRSIIVGFVDNTSFVLITKGKTQMLTLCMSGEATSKDASRQNWVFVTKAEASFLEEGPNPKVNFDTRWLVGRWLDMDGSGTEITTSRITVG